VANKTEEIRKYIFHILQQAKEDGFTTKDIRAGDIKKEMGLDNIPAFQNMMCWSHLQAETAPPWNTGITWMMQNPYSRFALQFLQKDELNIKLLKVINQSNGSKLISSFCWIMYLHFIIS